jgi:hypothetical protein
LQIQIEQRLSELKTEYQTGQTMLAELEAKQADLRQMLLRISGAIQVLEELLAAVPTTDNLTSSSQPTVTAPAAA